MSALPDTAQLNLKISAYANTTAEVINILADRVNSVLNILTRNGLKSSNWETTQLSIYPNTSYVDNVQITYGQIATQYILVKIPNLAADGSNLGKVYDGLAAVNGIEINGLTYDIADKTAILTQARGEAFKNAQKRAKDYTDAAGVVLGGPITVTDSYSVVPVDTPQLDSLPKVMAMRSSAAPTTTVTVGTIKVNYYLSAAFSFL